MENGLIVCNSILWLHWSPWGIHCWRQAPPPQRAPVLTHDCLCTARESTCSTQLQTNTGAQPGKSFSFAHFKQKCAQQIAKWVYVLKYFRNNTQNSWLKKINSAGREIYMYKMRTNICNWYILCHYLALAEAVFISNLECFHKEKGNFDYQHGLMLFDK